MLNEVSILEMAQGAVQEYLAREAGAVMRNIRDPNTDPKAARSITLTLTFKPNENRDSAQLLTKCTSKPAPLRPIETTLIIGEKNGEPVAMEYTQQLPGQMDVAGGEQAPSKIIRLA